MSIEVRKQDKETSQSLIRRFAKRVQKSGILLRARKRRFHQRSKSKEMRKKTALRKEKLRAEYEKLKKLGLSRR